MPETLPKKPYYFLEIKYPPSLAFSPQIIQDINCGKIKIFLTKYYFSLVCRFRGAVIHVKLIRWTLFLLVDMF